MSTETMVLAAVLTAIVIVLQLVGSFIRFGPFSVSLVLIPIVIGAATCGKWIGAWLGLIFGVAVLISGDAAAFLQISIPGTLITVLLKGIACGLFAGLVYSLIEKKNKWIAVIAAAIVCPVVNTLVFILGCLVFFFDALAAGGFVDTLSYIILTMVGANFLFELGFNMLLGPAIVRILNIRKK